MTASEKHLLKLLLAEKAAHQQTVSEAAGPTPGSRILKTPHDVNCWLVHAVVGSEIEYQTHEIMELMRQFVDEVELARYLGSPLAWVGFPDEFRTAMTVYGKARNLPPRRITNPPGPEDYRPAKVEL